MHIGKKLRNLEKKIHMYTNKIVKQVRQDITNWTINFVEQSNKFYGGKFPVCPYAKQARLKGETTYSIYQKGDYRKFVARSITKLINNKKFKQMLIIMPPNAKWFIGNTFVDNANKIIIKHNLFALKGRANGTRSKYPGWTNKGEYFIIGLNTLDKVLPAVEVLKKKGYYKNWSKKHYDYIVVKRQKMFEQYGKDSVKNFYDKHSFPGKYTQTDIKKYYKGNRYINFIQKYCSDNTNVLDAGCGTGFITNYLAYSNKNIKFTGIDFSNALFHAKTIRDKLKLKNTVYNQKDLLSFKSNVKYDTIICQGVLHHIPAYTKAIKNLKGMCKANGTLIIGVYHPWGKFLQKVLPNNYDSKILKTDQFKNPFEISFTKSKICELFSDYQLIKTYPSSIMNYKNGGLTMYVFRKIR